MVIIVEYKVRTTTTLQTFFDDTQLSEGHKIIATSTNLYYRFKRNFVVSYLLVKRRTDAELLHCNIESYYYILKHNT